MIRKNNTHTIKNYISINPLIEYYFNKLEAVALANYLYEREGEKIGLCK